MCWERDPAYESEDPGLRLCYPLCLIVYGPLRKSLNLAVTGGVGNEQGEAQDSITTLSH